MQYICRPPATVISIALGEIAYQRCRLQSTEYKWQGKTEVDCASIHGEVTKVADTNVDVFCLLCALCI